MISCCTFLAPAMREDEIIKVFVGADRSQQAAVKVLEYSIRRHTKARVELVPMIDLPVPLPKDPRNWQRTGFSYSRFCIPKLAGYSGRAIYMDADMLVFRDLSELWNLPFNGARVLVQQEVKHLSVSLSKENAPCKRIKQCAVMLLDCSRLDWNIESIVDDMDHERYSYEQLMYGLCILKDEEVGYTVPFEWNSLEYFDASTRLIHYTDMGTQPWVSTKNPNAHLWFSEVRRMIADGSLDLRELQAEIRAGYFRPSLIRDIRLGHHVPSFLKPLFDRLNAETDKLSGYVPHQIVYEFKRLRNKGIREYEAGLKARKVV